MHPCAHLLLRESELLTIALLQEKVPGLIYVDLETDKGSNIRDSLMSSLDAEDGRPITSSGSGREQGGQPPPMPG